MVSLNVVAGGMGLDTPVVKQRRTAVARTFDHARITPSSRRTAPRQQRSHSNVLPVVLAVPYFGADSASQCWVELAGPTNDSRHFFLRTWSLPRETLHSTRATPVDRLRRGRRSCRRCWPVSLVVERTSWLEQLIAMEQDARSRGPLAADDLLAVRQHWTFLEQLGEEIQLHQQSAFRAARQVGFATSTTSVHRLGAPSLEPRHQGAASVQVRRCPTPLMTNASAHPTPQRGGLRTHVRARRSLPKRTHRQSIASGLGCTDDMTVYTPSRQ